MTNSQRKPDSQPVMEVSEDEVEAYAEVLPDTGGYVPVETSPLAQGLDAAFAGSADPAPAAAPPPLPQRRAWRPRPALVLAVAVLCTAAGLAGGLLWNLLRGTGELRASGTAEEGETATDAQSETANVQIRLDELVVTSGDSKETEPPPDDSPKKR